MTFLMNNRLTIEVYDLIKSQGGKITVWKELRLLAAPKTEKEKKWFRWPNGREDSETLPEEPQYGLGSKLKDKEWFIGWNHAECDLQEDPIPIIIPEGQSMGPNMLHVWLNKPDNSISLDWIPFTAYLEDLIGAGTTGECYGGVQAGFKKLYLAQADKELGTKMLLEKKDSMSDRDALLAAWPKWGQSTPQAPAQSATQWSLLAQTIQPPNLPEWKRAYNQALQAQRELAQGRLIQTGAQSLAEVEARARALTMPKLSSGILNPDLF